MIGFSNEVIEQIKLANSDEQVKDLVVGSILKFEERTPNKFNSRRRYLINLIAALKYIKNETLPESAVGNVNKAVDFAEQVCRKEQYKLF